MKVTESVDVNETIRPRPRQNQVLRGRDQNQRDWERDRDQCSQMHKRSRCRYSQQFSTL